MKIEKLLFVLLAVLLVFSLFGCGKKSAGATEPQDTTGQLDRNTSDVAIDGEAVDPFLAMTDAEADAYNEKYSDIMAFLPEDNQLTGTGEADNETAGTPDENTGGYYDDGDDLSLVDWDSRNVYEGAHIEREVSENGWGGECKADIYETPSYQIVG